MAPLDLDREEEKFIFKFQTKVLGLNRIVVTRQFSLPPVVRFSSSFFFSQVAQLVIFI